ncbi:MAG: DUF4242 domain-containing protein [Betaproteobacteria bacterium]|nr:MAG: DUF4242 domain-containing protein [Betaproteobacteria bacterium]
MKTQGKYGVEYRKYWLNESCGKIFCLCTAPNSEAAASVHREAHGVVARARPGDSDRSVHRYRWLDRGDATPWRRRSDCFSSSPRHDRPRCPRCNGRPRGQAHRRRHHGVLRVDGRGGSLRHSDQRALAEREQANKEVPVKVRIGAAAGEPVENHLDLFRSTVQLAARLCAHAEPEQSLVSNAVAELCLGKGLTFQDLGEVLLKGFDRPVRVHAVQ